MATKKKPFGLDTDLRRKAILEEIKAIEEKITEEGKLHHQTQKRLNRLKEESSLIEKSMVKIRTHEEGIQKRIETSLKNQKGFYTGFLKSVVKLDFQSAGELLNKKAVGKLQQKQTAEQKNFSKVLQVDVKNNEVTVKDREKLLGIQDGIAKGTIKQKDVAGQLQGLSNLGVKKAGEYGKLLKGQAGTQGKIGKVLTKGAGGMGVMLKRAGAVGVAIGVLLDIAKKFAASVDAIGNQFGSLNVLSDEFKGNLMDSQMEVVGIGATMEDVVATTSALAGEFGISLNDASALSAQIIDTAKAVGLSNEEAAKLSGILQTTSGLSAEQAEQLTEGAFQLAVANNVAPDAVMKDMASAAEEFASFSKDGGDNLAKAAVQARAMGLSLQDTAKISEGLLNFQDSISKEIEASVLIGRQLNLQKARELALNNDIEGAMRAVVDQLGSEQEFNNLNAIQRKALADSIGVEVSQLAKMVANQEKVANAAQESAKSFEDIIGKEAMSELTATMNELKIFGVALAQTLGPLLMLVAKAVNLLLVPLGNAVVSISSSLRGAFGGATMDDGVVGPGGISMMAGSAGVFKLNPRDSVMATTNPIPVNDIRTGPPGSMGGGTNVQVSSRMVKLGGGDLGLAIDAYTYPSNSGQGRQPYNSLTGRAHT